LRLAGEVTLTSLLYADAVLVALHVALVSAKLSAADDTLPLAAPPRA
jgi:hypothetical protein